MINFCDFLQIFTYAPEIISQMDTCFTHTRKIQHTKTFVPVYKIQYKILYKIKLSQYTHPHTIPLHAYHTLLHNHIIQHMKTYLLQPFNCIIKYYTKQHCHNLNNYTHTHASYVILYF